MAGNSAMFEIRDSKQFWSGLLFAATGAGALWTLPLPLGTVKSMGPGYFPMLLGIGLLLVGISSVVLSFRASEIIRIDRLSLVPVFFILSGVVIAALLIDNYGLALSLLVLVLTTCYSRVLRHPIEITIIYLVVLLMTWGVFIYLIQLPIKLFW
jgi:hypothetical protein